jgi:hypothetical protein
MNGSQRYNFDELREQINNAILNKNMSSNLYESTNGITRIIDSIIKTKGKGWAAQVVNDDGNQILSEQEQIQFTEAFQPYIDIILNYFGIQDDMMGGAYEPNISNLSSLSDNFLKKKVEEVTQSSPNNSVETAGIDDMYTKIIDRVNNVNSTVNNYASKYGLLKLEKEHDLEPDIRVIPEPAALAISDGVLGLSTTAGVPIPPEVTMEVLSKIKIPFRLIIFSIYLILDIARLAMGITGPPLGRKIMSVLMSILELLRGDWKKAILTIIGYYGMMPMLIGELCKVFLTLFRMLAPQIQDSIVFGALDTTKSFIIGLLLAIFKVSAPEEVRLPLIGVLEKIAQRKAEMDGTLEDIGLSARPDYLSPTWNDFNNIQAVMSDDAYICSCEFEELVKAVNNAPIIRLILEMLRIPVSQKMIEFKCGKGACKDFVVSVVEDAKEATDKKEKQTNATKIGGRILHSRLYKSSSS